MIYQTDQVHHMVLLCWLSPTWDTRMQKRPLFHHMISFKTTLEPYMLVFQQTTSILYQDQPKKYLVNWIWLTVNLARPKSQTFTLKPSSISILWLLMSLCTIPKWCMYWNTIAESLAIFNLYFALRFTEFFFIWSISYKLPWLTCSNTMYKSGIFGITPIRMAIFGCLKILCITISFWISCKSSSVSLGSNIFLIATGVPLSFPLWITEKPPYAIFSPISISSIVISLTPGTGGSLPDETETLVAWVKAEKFYF